MGGLPYSEGAAIIDGESTSRNCSQGSKGNDAKVESHGCKIGGRRVNVVDKRTRKIS